MAIRDVLEDLENLVADAAHVPLSGKCMIDENDLVHLVEELRNGLPTALSQAEDIMTERETILAKARSEADHIISDAKKDAERRISNTAIEREAKERARAMLDEANEKARIMMDEANEKARVMMDEANAKANEMVEEARQRGEDIYLKAVEKKSNVDQYVNQVLDQVISHVTATVNGIQQLEHGLQQGVGVLSDVQNQMNQEANEVSRRLAQG
ncbi:MAG: hypothetical protein J6O04_12265 [Selenomonadaceae bacterium]|nr:hypothetical protein [Selenomonadaceae bacterium]